MVGNFINSHICSKVIESHQLAMADSIYAIFINSHICYSKVIESHQLVMVAGIYAMQHLSCVFTNSAYSLSNR